MHCEYRRQSHANAHLQRGLQRAVCVWRARLAWTGRCEKGMLRGGGYGGMEWEMSLPLVASHAHYASKAFVSWAFKASLA